MESRQLRYLLEQLHFSAALPPDVLDRFAASASLRELAAGEVVFREGSENPHLHLICSGHLALEMNVPGRGPVRILTLGPGEMVGWSALLSRDRMTATAVAVEPSSLIVAPAETLRALCDNSPAFGYPLMRQMAEALSKRLIATRLQLLDMFADAPAPPRLNLNEPGGGKPQGPAAEDRS